MTRPTKQAEWADSSTNIVEPTSGRKLQGWDIGQVPSSGNQNWWQNEVFQWLQYLDASFGTITGASTTLTVDSDDVQVCSGSTDKTIKLPDETTLAVGRRFRFIVTGTGTVIVKDSSNTTLETLSALASGQRTLFADFISISAGFSANHWYWQYNKPGQIFGTTTNDNAAAGVVGERLFIQRQFASAVQLSSFQGNICNLPGSSITLTGGNWRLSATAYFQNGVVDSVVDLGVSTASATMPANSLIATPNISSGEARLTGILQRAGAGVCSLAIPSYTCKVLAGTTKTLFLVADTTDSNTFVNGSFEAVRQR